MKLTHIRIKDFRSFSGEHEFDVSSGVNYFVGPNNCGKSNLVRALELATEPVAHSSLPATVGCRPASAARSRTSCGG
jgi:putative ATP-dependent endonuclease of the OLD family